eukprot:CAMPEP_0202895398 /NCGR_PEP_ID=MMETSP1392-20130828/4619_1 /ASSEMBLY_ACC=CAM_ASM_000868 /TAXON_ID=225041 /ORGANISM="Chlamydomonas chlamydogama, Strain SAG 11-48b" /LENGTH=114 /DNA_ID=CAMNT_0049580405 /DNA_START=510 /DNA_END=854 /DNA_ORIENTATION=-
MQKAALWSRYAAAHGIDPAASTCPDYLWASRSMWPIHVQLVFFILERVLAHYHEVAVVKYTLQVPPWLAGWCQRWGLRPPDDVISITAVHAYAPGGSSQGECPIRVLYVPNFGP